MQITEQDGTEGYRMKSPESVLIQATTGIFGTKDTDFMLGLMLGVLPRNLNRSVTITWPEAGSESGAPAPCSLHRLYEHS